MHFYVLPCLKVYRRFIFMCAPYIYKFNRSVFYPVLLIDLTIHAGYKFLMHETEK